MVRIYLISIAVFILLAAVQVNAAWDGHNFVEHSHELTVVSNGDTFYVHDLNGFEGKIEFVNEVLILYTKSLGNYWFNFMIVQQCVSKDQDIECREDI